MMTRKSNIMGMTLLIIFCMLTLAGCQLALENENISGGNATAGNDRLIGVFVTMESLDLFDINGYLNDNKGSISGSEIKVDENKSKQYQGRLYAVLKDKTIRTDKGEEVITQDYVFEGINGFSYFSAKIPATETEESYITSGSDEAISDRNNSFSYGDTEDKVNLEGTIYLSPKESDTILYGNPVYQSDDGSVYTVNGNGFMVNSSDVEGSMLSFTLEETNTVTENKKSKKVSFSMKLTVENMFLPEEIKIIQMDLQNQKLAVDSYALKEVPEKILPKIETVYILVETYKKDLSGKTFVTREIFDSNDEMLFTFYSREDGICIKKWTELQWEKS